VCEGKAITIRPSWEAVRAAKAEGKIIVVSTSPSVRVGIAEAFGGEPGLFQQAQCVALLRALGADVVLDVGFGADITIVEEAAELLERLAKSDSPLPMFTSCCPSWVAFCELFYPELLPNVSRVKSPIAMQGATIKSYFAEKKGLDPKQIFNVALTPCPAKKYEINRSELNVRGLQDMDAIVTVRELPNWLAAEGISYDATKTSPYDTLMGEASSAGILFGNTGGVAESILRTAYVMANKTLPPPDFFELTPLRGLLPARTKVKTATIQLLPQRTITVAVVQGLANARLLIKMIKDGQIKVDFVEVMACEAGCVGGAGMPLSKIQPYVSKAMRQARLDALQAQDSQRSSFEQRVSWLNAPLRKLYDEFYLSPASAQAREYLHTRYTSRAHLLEVSP
jgi:ferredoxin hydrogenase